MTTIESIFRPEELQRARAEVLNETVKELAGFSRRASEPAKRVALAELEQLLRATRAKWAEAGLVAPEATAEAA